MNGNNNEFGKQESAPGQNKVSTIIVNCREHSVDEKKISYEEIIKLSGQPAPAANGLFTVTFERGKTERSQGAMVSGDEVPIKNGMVFNVATTNKS